MKYRHPDGKLHDRPSFGSGPFSSRDNIVLTRDDVVEVVRIYFAQRYGQEIPPTVHVREILGTTFEIEFATNEDEIPF